MQINTHPIQLKKKKILINILKLLKKIIENHIKKYTVQIKMMLHTKCTYPRINTQRDYDLSVVGYKSHRSEKKTLVHFH